MHKRTVFYIVSRLLLIMCLIMTVPLGWALWDNPGSVEVFAFLVTILLGIASSFVVRWFVMAREEEVKMLNAKDGLAIVGLSWLCLSAFGALPFYFSEAVPSYVDAFFETVSGFTTTGATVIANVEALPRGLLFWRSLTHWLGGMGIIVLYLALLPALGQAAFQLYKAEAPGPTAERLQPRIKETAKILWGVYVLFSALETALLMKGGMTLFDALCHTFGTMATGGFSTRNASIAAFNPYTQWVIIVFMFIAGTNFMLHYLALRGDFRSLRKSDEFRCYFFLVALLVPVFALVLRRTVSPDIPVRQAAFQVVSILTTTGYTTADFDAWPHALRLTLLILMFIGGCAGSTGGGMKVIRVFLTVKMALRSVLQALLPNAVVPIKVNKTPVPDRVATGVLSYVVIFITLFFIGAVLLTVTERCDLVTAFSASIACLGNIGPGLGRVGATQNYAWMTPAGKYVLTFLMLAGRLELYSILILFSPTAWRK